VKLQKRESWADTEVKLSKRERSENQRLRVERDRHWACYTCEL
jgi:hypothetical protein